MIKINGFMMAAGFDPNKPKSDNKPKNKKPKRTSEEIKAATRLRFQRQTNNIVRQKEVVNAVISGYRTSESTRKLLSHIPFKTIKGYLKRNFDDGNLSRVKIKSEGTYEYSVTAKGLELVGSKNA